MLRLLTLAWLAMVLAADQVVFRSQVDTVLLDVFVTERGVAVPNLAVGDFEVRDNSVLQTLTHLSGEPSALGVHLLLDTSGSLSTRDLENLRHGAAALAGILRPDDELSLVTFAEVVRLHQDVSPKGLDVTFRNLRPEGDTVLNDALASVFHLADRPSSRRPVIIVFSDGTDTASWLDAAALERAARLSWASLFAISPRRLSEPMLSNLVELTGGEVIVLGEDLSALAATLLQVLDRLRQRYLLAFTPSSSSRGWHELDVRVRRPNVKVVARRGYVRR